jgi:hypothetical protein
MNLTRKRRNPATSRRRYLIHLSGLLDYECARCHYIARIRPWTARTQVRYEMRKRVFADECELIATINPLLPPGSDVRDVFEHIENPNGFFYLLRLNGEEAAQLGWQYDMTLGGAG